MACKKLVWVPVDLVTSDVLGTEGTFSAVSALVFNSMACGNVLGYACNLVNIQCPVTWRNGLQKKQKPCMIFPWTCMAVAKLRPFWM